MLAAWTISVNRRQEKVISTKPAMWGRKAAPALPKIFACIVNAGNFKPTSDVLNSGSEPQPKFDILHLKTRPEKRVSRQTAYDGCFEGRRCAGGILDVLLK